MPWNFFPVRVTVLGDWGEPVVRSEEVHFLINKDSVFLFNLYNTMKT